MIVIIDFGSQTAHLISRRLERLGIKVALVEPSQALQKIGKFKPAGIILSGGPASVYEPNSPTLDPKIFDLHLPVLGICYGWQLTARLLGGKVVSGNREYGPTKLKLETSNGAAVLCQELPTQLEVWMSHGDEVTALPEGFSIAGSTTTVPAAVVADTNRNIYGLQFHPEVEHTQNGTQFLKNFAQNICGLTISEKVLDVNEVIAQVREQANQKGEHSRAIAAVSGGVDSTVAAAIVAKAIGDRFVPVFCNNGLMREGVREEVVGIFQNNLNINPIIVDCRDEFLEALKGITDPEAKRKIIGTLYIRKFEEVAKEQKDITFLVQGTIYSDVIESQGSKHASKIKSHHNVGGLPEDLGFTLLEPLRSFYKDEVRELGRQLGLPEEVVNKQPFPGPGQAIRIIGEVTEKRLAKQQKADQIVLEVMRTSGWYDKVFQSFPIMTGAMSTAVKGDGRVYGEVVGLRIYDSSDIMTAGWTHLPYEVLQQLSSRIVNEVEDVSRVVYDITTKPPATMEWE